MKRWSGFIISALIISVLLMGCTQAITGRVESVEFKQLALGNIPVTNIVIVTDNGSKYYAGLFDHGRELMVGDVVWVKLGNNLIALSEETERIKKQDGTVKFVRRQIRWMEIVAYRVISRASQ